MFDSSKRLRLAILLGAVTLLAFSVPVSAQLAPPTLGSMGNFRSVQPRNPKTDNGETQRIVTRDAFGRVLSIAIEYQDRSTGTITKDASGKTASIEVNKFNGMVITGKPDETGRAIAEGTLHGANGVIIMERHKSGTKTTSTFYDSGGDVRLKEIVDGAETIRQLFTPGGVLLFEEYLHNNLRTSLKMYSQGKLTYEEHVTTQNPHFGGLIAYEGTVFNDDGKPTHRVMLTEGPFDNGGGHPRQIDTLADDGQTVTATAKLDYNTRDKIPLGHFSSQVDLVKLKQTAWQTVNTVRQHQIPLDSTLSPLLNDNTR